jgi:hypothetical protein
VKLPAQQRLRARLLGGDGELDRGRGVVAARAGDHRHTASRDRDRGLDQLPLLRHRQQRGLAGRTAGYQRANAAFDQPFAEASEGVEVDPAETVRSRQRGADAAHAGNTEGHDTPLG